MTEELLTVTTTSAATRIAVLSVAGELDHDSRAVLSDAAEAAIRTGHDRLILDLGGVSFCDSGGLALFAELHRRAAAGDGELRLACLQPPVLAVLRATNLDRILPLHPTVDAAVQAAQARG
jgi:anti-sigma B factor antagonist